MNPKPVDQWPAAELARWMVERDVTTGMIESWGGLDRAIAAVLDHEGDPTCSLDAVTAWLGRRGLDYARAGGASRLTSYVAVYKTQPDDETQYFTETPDIPTAHALCVAGVKAQMAKEAAQ